MRYEIDTIGYAIRKLHGSRGYIDIVLKRLRQGAHWRDTIQKRHGSRGYVQNVVKRLRQSAHWRDTKATWVARIRRKFTEEVKANLTLARYDTRYESDMDREDTWEVLKRLRQSAHWRDTIRNRDDRIRDTKATWIARIHSKRTEVLKTDLAPKIDLLKPTLIF
jgi:hypothetical protein